LAEWSARREAAKVAALASEADATRQRILCEFVERAPDSQYFPRTFTSRSYSVFIFLGSLKK
jgi:hypothetical protein